MQSLPLDIQHLIASVLCAMLVNATPEDAIHLLVAVRCAMRGVLFEKVRDGVLRNWRAHLQRDAPWLLTAYFPSCEDPQVFTVPFRTLGTVPAHQIYTAFKALWVARELRVRGYGDTAEAAKAVIRQKMANPKSELRRAWRFLPLGVETRKWRLYVALSREESCTTTMTGAVAGTFVHTDTRARHGEIGVTSAKPRYHDPPRPPHHLTPCVRVAATTVEDMNNILDPFAQRSRPLCYASVYARREATPGTPPHCVPLLLNEAMRVQRASHEIHMPPQHPGEGHSTVRYLFMQTTYVSTEGCATHDEVYAGTHVGPSKSTTCSVRLGLVTTTTEQPNGSLVTVVDGILDNGETNITADIYHVPK